VVALNKKQVGWFCKVNICSALGRVSPKIASSSFVPVSSSFLFESRKSFSAAKPNDNLKISPKQKTSLQVVYLNAKKDPVTSQKTLDSSSLVVQIAFSGNSCFTFHELSLDCQLIEIVNGSDLAPQPITCVSHPDTTGKRVTLEFQLSPVSSSARIVVQAVHTQTGKFLASLKTETEEFFVRSSKKRNFSDFDENASPLPPQKFQRVLPPPSTLIDDICSLDLEIHFEDFFDLDFSNNSPPISPAPAELPPQSCDDIFNLLGLEC